MKTLEAFKENNTHLLQVLDKYDIKLTKMQEDIDVRDLRIHELLEKHEEDGKGTTNYTLIIFLIYSFNLVLDLDVIETRVKFLIKLLERCRERLEKEAAEDDASVSEHRERILEMHRISLKEDESQEQSEPGPQDSMVKALQDYYVSKVHSYSESKNVSIDLM